MGALDTWDGMMRLAQEYGPYLRSVIYQNSGGATAAISTAGVIPAARMPNPLVLPASFGTGVKGIRFVNINGQVSNGQTMLLVGLEYLLGTLDMNTGTFTDGVVMPTKIVNGESVQTAAMWTFLTVTANVTATSPVVTVTYTNQDGTTSRSAALTLPSNPVNTSAYWMTRHLQGNDTAIRDVTNMTKSAGSAGTVRVYGLLPLQTIFSDDQGVTFLPKMAEGQMPQWVCEASENIGFYRMGRDAHFGGGSMICNLYGLPEV